MRNQNVSALVFSALLGVVLAVAWLILGNAAPAAATEPAPPIEEVGLYCYGKVDPALPASWENSGFQSFAASKVGSEWFTDEEARSLCAVPVTACEPGAFAYQQDKVRYEGEFVWPSTIQYPVDNIGWPPIYEAKHGDLLQSVDSSLCSTSTPTPTPPPTDECGTVDTLACSGPVDVWLFIPASVLIVLSVFLLMFSRARRETSFVSAPAHKEV